MLLNSANSLWLVHISACFYHVCPEPQTRLRNKHHVLGFWSLDRSLSNRKLSFFSLVYTSCFENTISENSHALVWRLYYSHLCTYRSHSRSPIYLKTWVCWLQIFFTESPLILFLSFLLLFMTSLTSVVNFIISFYDNALKQSCTSALMWSVLRKILVFLETNDSFGGNNFFWCSILYI